MTVSGWDSELGPIVAIPEPFWVRRWFRWRTACYECQMTLGTREAYERHYLSTHYEVPRDV